MYPLGVCCLFSTAAVLPFFLIPDVDLQPEHLKGCRSVTAVKQRLAHFQVALRAIGQPAAVILGF